MCIYIHLHMDYGVATITRLLETIGLFCERTLQKKLYSTKETYNLKEPTNRRHPILVVSIRHVYTVE